MCHATLTWIAPIGDAAQQIDEVNQLPFSGFVSRSILETTRYEPRQEPGSFTNLNSTQNGIQ
jgi:hypothetical protein